MKKEKKKSRLDMILNSITKADILPSYRSDHSPTVLEFKWNDFKTGKVFWKFNVSLLSDIKYLNMINNTIEQTTREYIVPIYNLDNLSNISNTDIFFTINDQLLLETLLMNIRGKSISYSSYLNNTILIT